MAVLIVEMMESAGFHLCMEHLDVLSSEDQRLIDRARQQAQRAQPWAPNAAQERPALRTDSEDRAAARAADDDLLQGKGWKDSAHSRHTSGVKSSHVMQGISTRPGHPPRQLKAMQCAPFFLWRARRLHMSSFFAAVRVVVDCPTSVMLCVYLLSVVSTPS